jgi:hypothetical protein
MEQIVVNSSIAVHNIAILGLCVFGFVFLYLFILSRLIKVEMNNIVKAKELIEEGHENAINGRKDDGYYEETRRLRTEEESEELKESDKEVVNEED